MAWIRTYFGAVGGQTAAFILAALSFSAALSWNSAIQSFIEERPALRRYGPWFGALLITAAAVLALLLLSPFVRKYAIPHPLVG